MCSSQANLADDVALSMYMCSQNVTCEDGGEIWVNVRGRSCRLEEVVGYILGWLGLAAAWCRLR